MGNTETVVSDKRTIGRQLSRRRSRSPKSSKSLLKTGKKSIKGLITGKSKRNLKSSGSSVSSTLSESASSPSIVEEEVTSATTENTPVVVPSAPSSAEPTTSKPVPPEAEATTSAPILAEPKAEEVKPDPAPQDEETVYGMQLDDQSTSSSKTPSMLAESASKEELSIQVVLLIMDPKTRRFELLQLEFNPEKALTSDVIAQIKNSATEKVLTDLEYVGICDSKGNKLDGSKMLKTYCPEGNEILMALPKGMEAKKCTKLASPILKDPSVLAMIRPNSGLPPVEEDKTKEQIGNTKTPSDNLGAVPEVIKPNAHNRDISSLETEDEPHVSLTGFKYCLLIVIILYIAKYFEMNGPETKPLEIGSTFVAGDILSKCGAWDLVRPPRFQTCDPLTLKMGNDGVLTLSNGGPWRLWEGDDGHLPLIEMRAKNTFTGDVEVAEDGTVLIDGQLAKITYFDENAPKELSPWPFAVDLPARNGKRKKTGKKG